MVSTLLLLEIPDSSSRAYFMYAVFHNSFKCRHKCSQEWSLYFRLLYHFLQNGLLFWQWYWACSTSFSLHLCAWTRWGSLPCRGWRFFCFFSVHWAAWIAVSAFDLLLLHKSMDDCLLKQRTNANISMGGKGTSSPAVVCRQVPILLSSTDCNLAQT